MFRVSSFKFLKETGLRRQTTLSIKAITSRVHLGTLQEHEQPPAHGDERPGRGARKPSRVEAMKGNDYANKRTMLWTDHFTQLLTTSLSYAEKGRQSLSAQGLNT